MTAERPTHVAFIRAIAIGQGQTAELLFTNARGDVTYLRHAHKALFAETRIIGGRPRYPMAWLERRMQAPVTTRNWNTILRLLRFLDGAISVG